MYDVYGTVSICIESLPTGEMVIDLTSYGDVVAGIFTPLPLYALGSIL